MTIMEWLWLAAKKGMVRWIQTNPDVNADRAAAFFESLIEQVVAAQEQKTQTAEEAEVAGGA